MHLSEIEQRIVVSESGCWEWNGAHIPSGYGSVRYNGKNRVVHKLMYELRIGKVPNGLQLDHLCRNRGCCNPAHLEPVSQRVNLIRGDGFSGKNARKDRCPNGHEYDLVNKHGWRDCSVCKRAKRRRHYEAHSIATKPQASKRTHCPQGHEYSAENTYVYPRTGYRKCITCRDMQKRTFDSHRRAVLLGGERE